MEDYIKLPRSMLTDDLWRNNGAMLRVYMCIVAKSVDDNNPLSIAQISRVTQLTSKQVRTALKKLESSGKKTSRGANKRARKRANVIDCETDSYDVSGANKRARKRANVKTIPNNGFERFMEYFNNAVSETSIPQIVKLTDRRKNALLAIFKEYGKETVESVIQKVLDSDFLTREWGKASFDWIFKKANFIKILEGNYDNRPTVKEAYAVRGQTDRYSALENAADTILRRASDRFDSADDTLRDSDIT